MRRIFRSVLILFLTVSIASADDDSFFLSYWVGPPEATDARYAEIREANFTVALVSASTKEAAIAVLDLCRKHGLKALVYDSRLSGADPASPDFTKTVDAVIADYSGHPALYGYHLQDEPNAKEFPRLAAVVARLREKDAAHLAYINLFPNYASAEQLGVPSYEAHVETFCSTVKPRLLSYDHYALLAPDQPFRPEYFPNLDVLRRASLAHGIPFLEVVLSTPHGPYRDPSEADLRWQAFTALAYGAKGLSWFTYGTPHDSQWNFRNGILDEKGNRTAHYDAVKRLNGDVLALAPTLRELTSTGVYAAGVSLPGVPSLPEKGAPPLAALAGGPFLVGCFVALDGTAHLLIVNTDFKAPATARPTLSEGPRKLRLELFDPAGARWTAWPDEGVPIPPGDGRLARVMIGH